MAESKSSLIFNHADLGKHADMCTHVLRYVYGKKNIMYTV